MAKSKKAEASGLFDATAYQDDLAKLREKHLAGVKAKIAELSEQRNVIESELNKLYGLEAYPLLPSVLRNDA